MVFFVVVVCVLFLLVWLLLFVFVLDFSHDRFYNGVDFVVVFLNLNHESVDFSLS